MAKNEASKKGNSVIGATGFFLVIISVIATVCLLAFHEAIRELEWLDLEMAAMGSMGLCLLGSILGWCSFKTGTGKLAAILGTLLFACYLFQLMRGGSPESPIPRSISPSSED